MVADPPKTRPDKQKVIDEVWTDDRIAEFLHTPHPKQLGQKFAGDSDFYVLLRAYQAMRIHDFERFLNLFIDKGGNLNAKDHRDRSLVERIAHHRKATPFIDAIESRRG